MIKCSLCVLLLASGLQSSWAYSLGGPTPGYPGLRPDFGDSWQTPVIRYGSVKGPKNLGEEYRRNTPVMYWTYDATFYDYFKTNGVNALRSAFAIYNALTNVDNYSPQLSEFPLESKHLNYQAQALGLIDLKSYTVGLMAEQLGLANSVQYTWTLHNRSGPVCPTSMSYIVVQRNYDFISDPLNQLQYSPYVNNVLYSYTIVENCTPPNPLAYASPFSVDPLADNYTPVSAFTEDYPNADLILLYWGEFYTGLTRDDVAGLRYLLTKNNINMEDVAPGASLLTTNFGGYTFLTTSNLNTLLLASQTNAPGLIPGLFPGVTVTSSTTNFGVLYTPITTTTVRTIYGTPYPGVPVISVVTNGYISTPMLLYQDTFGGIITNANLTNTPNIVLNGAKVVLSYSTNMSASLVTVSLGTLYGSPYPAPVVTNTTVQTITLTNAASGEYFTIPAGQCGWSFMSPQPNGYPLTNVVATTNLIATVTNTSTGASNSVGFVGSVSLVTYFTNHTYVAAPVICGQTTTNPPGLYEGIGQVQFVEADYDSLLGQYWRPVTNNYTMTLVTNSQTVVQHFQRVVTAPDFLFTAADLAPAAIFRRNLNFDVGRILPSLAGPGTIIPATTITFNKSGPLYYNAYADTMDGTPYFTEFPGGDLTDLFYSSYYYVWASYDSTTNAPVVYPNGTSVETLQNQVLINVTPATLPGDYFSDTPHGPVTFTATGGAFTQPYTWSASGLPTGLTLVSNADSTATLSGTPAQTGKFDFILTLTDYVGRSVQFGYSITIQ